MKTSITQRGFARTEWEDLYGNECSLQKSSAALYDAIWLGIDQPEINIQIDGGWKAIAVPADAVIHSRMHLSQKMVREMLPALQHFAETGELPNQDT